MSNSRLLCEIEEILRKGADTRHAKYDKKTVEEHKSEIQEILGVINPQSLSSGGNLSVVGNPTSVAHAVSGGTATISLVESGAR